MANKFLYLTQHRARARVERGRAPGIHTPVTTTGARTRRARARTWRHRLPRDTARGPRGNAGAGPGVGHGSPRGPQSLPRLGIVPANTASSVGAPQRLARRARLPSRRRRTPTTVATAPRQGATRQRARHCGCADARLPSSLGHLGAGISRGRIEGGDNSLAHLANKFMFLPQGQARAHVERGARVPGISYTCHKNRRAHA